MTISEVIQPGDKVDIRLVQEINNPQIVDSMEKVYKSQVLDLCANGNVEISMPLDGTKLILLPLGVRFEFVFYSKGALYATIGQVVERYKKDNLFMLEIEIKSTMEKFQRREYYRHTCAMDIIFYQLTKEQAALDTIDAIYDSLREDILEVQKKRGVIVDLSGGGARMNSEYEFEAGDNLLLELGLENDKIHRQCQIIGDIISCHRIENRQERIFESRIKFRLADNKEREEIVQYIFEEERRKRQKVQR